MSKTYTWIFLVLIGLFTFNACQQKAAKPSKAEKKVVAKQKATTKKTASSNKSPKSKLNLTDQQKKRIKEIQKTYQDKIDSLKKQNKWAGADNSATRKQITDAKQKELKTLLEDKYDQYRKLVTTPKKKPKPQKK